jgi:hypothetical protein
MSHEAFPNIGPDSTHADSGDPNRDRADLAEQAPAAADDEKIHEHTAPIGGEEEAGTDADAART